MEANPDKFQVTLLSKPKHSRSYDFCITVGDNVKLLRDFIDMLKNFSYHTGQHGQSFSKDSRQLNGLLRMF